jgi:hypothetical protein
MLRFLIHLQQRKLDEIAAAQSALDTPKSPGTAK